MRMNTTLTDYIRRSKRSVKRTAFFLLQSVLRVLSFKKPLVKARYLKTRGGRFRARYIFASIIVLCFLTMSLAMSGLNKTGFMVGADRVAMNDAANLNGVEPAAMGGKALSDSEKDIVAFNQLREDMNPGLLPSPRKVLPKEWQRTVSLEKGDTLSRLLTSSDVGAGDAYQAIKAMSKKISPRDLKAGQDITLFFNRDDDMKITFSGMDIVKSGIERVAVRRKDDFGFDAKMLTKKVVVEKRAAKVTISNSLFADLAKAGVPDGIIGQMIKTYSWSIDFQRDIQGGEKVEVLYSVRVTEDGSYMRSHELLYANLMIKGKERPIYLFEKKDGTQDYYDTKGRTVRKALLKTPVDGARVSSGYGLRRHPVLGYSKMHKGIDFAAPTGTPVYAAGKGVIERASRFSSFGNYVKIKHNDKYHTAYAHLHKYGKGIRKGVRVKQGQIIGYVGTTGRSTGPHLHYEIHVNGRATNPRSVTLPIGETLGGTNLANFKKKRATHDANFKAMLKKNPYIKASSPNN